MPHRHSFARLRTADELSEVLAAPIYFILAGKAEPTFPQSFTAAPSYDVLIRWTTGNLPPGAETTRLPVYVHWKQWKEVCVPLLEDPTYLPTNPLWLCRQEELLVTIQGSLQSRAVAAGYGSPDQADD